MEAIALLECALDGTPDAFESRVGSVELGHPTGTHNAGIDADLARADSGSS